jgi:putative ABC transport system permease protein
MNVRLAARLVTVEAVRSLARNKMRSGLAMLGILVGVATVIWVIAIGTAGTAQALSALDDLGDNLVWIEAGSRNAAGVRTGTHGMQTLVPADADAIRREAGKIARVSENVDGRLQVIYGGNNWATQYRGISPDYAEVRKWRLARGAFITDDDVAKSRTVIVIGDTVKRKLFGDDDAIGQKIRIGSSLFDVVGVLAVKGQTATGGDQDDTVMMPWTTAFKRVARQTWLDDIVCSAATVDEIRDAGAEVSALLRERHHIQPGAEDDFNIRHPEDLLKAKVESARTLQKLLAAIALMSLLVGGIGIMNVMLASVAQRKAEIGIRVAVGARPAAIQLQFLAEAVVLTTSSGILGVTLGIAAAPKISETLQWRLTMSPEIDVLALGFAIAVGVCFGFYPAWRASQLDPITALRVEA